VFYLNFKTPKYKDFIDNQALITYFFQSALAEESLGYLLVDLFVLERVYHDKFLVFFDKQAYNYHNQ
jgi:hypothetical protein